MAAIASSRCIVIALVAGLASVGTGAAQAGDDSAETTQITRVDVPNVAARSLPGYRTDLVELSYQRWATHGRTGVGIGVGSLMLLDRPNGMLLGRVADGLTPGNGSATMLMLGLRYRATPQSSIYADAAHVRGLGLEGEDRVVSKVGIELKAAQSDWKIAYGGLGFRLAGDARMTLKVRRGGLSIAMRRTF